VSPASVEVGRRNSDGAGLEQRLAQSLDRALVILESFGSVQPEAGVQELAGRLALTPSTVSRLLATLKRRGYVEQDQFTGRFRLGLSALELGYRYAATSDLIVRAAPQLDMLAQQLGMNAHLYGLDRGQLIRYVSVLNPPRQALTGGCRFRAHTTASGKLLLAYVDAQELARLLETVDLPPATPRTITTVEELRKDLEAIRQRGYGIDNEESRLGNACLAVPVRDAAGTVIAAISVSGPVSGFGEGRRSQIVEQLFDRAYQLSQAMGYLTSQAV
jgi:IclR family acetate operon transcriptional repressor